MLSAFGMLVPWDPLTDHDIDQEVVARLKEEWDLEFGMPMTPMALPEDFCLGEGADGETKGVPTA